MIMKTSNGRIIVGLLETKRRTVLDIASDLASAGYALDDVDVETVRGTTEIMLTVASDRKYGHYPQLSTYERS